MSEKAVIIWACDKCGHKNKPNGDRLTVLPAFLALVKCENCGYELRGAEWSDSETKMLMERKERGLPLTIGTPSQKLESLTGELQVLKESRDADRKEIQLIRQQVDLLTSQEIKQVKADAQERDELITSLVLRVKELEDWRKFADKEK